MDINTFHPKYKIILGVIVILVVIGIAVVVFTGGNAPKGADNGGVYCSPDGTLTDTMPIQSHRSYCIKSTASEKAYMPNTPVTYSFSIIDDRGETLKDFAIVHDKIMHFIVVRKDLQEFQHLHPDYNEATGEFAVNIAFRNDGPYRMFPDFTPAKNAGNPQLLPVTLFQDMVVGNINNYKAQAVVPDGSTIKKLGAYQISYTVPEPLVALESVTYTLSIARNNKPIVDLEPYLGALGHSVILNADTLDFIHTHAESGTDTGPIISFSTTFPDAGVYKTFTQFQHQNNVVTSEYTLVVTPNMSTEFDDQPEHNVH